MRNFDPADLSELLGGTGYLPLGLPALRAAIARLLTADGLPTSEDQVLVTTGAPVEYGQALFVISLH